MLKELDYIREYSRLNTASIKLERDSNDQEFKAACAKAREGALAAIKALGILESKAKETIWIADETNKQALAAADKAAKDSLEKMKATMNPPAPTAAPPTPQEIGPVTTSVSTAKKDGSKDDKLEDSLIKAYKKYKGEMEAKGKGVGYSEPEIDKANNCVKLSFPSIESRDDFLTKYAQENKDTPLFGIQLGPDGKEKEFLICHGGEFYKGTHDELQEKLKTKPDALAYFNAQYAVRPAQFRATEAPAPAASATPQNMSTLTPPTPPNEPSSIHDQQTLGPLHEPADEYEDDFEAEEEEIEEDIHAEDDEEIVQPATPRPY